MSFSVGIVGLPNVGKSTLFKALTRKQVEIAPRPFTTIHPNIGIVSVPDQRLEKIAKIIKPERVTPTTIKFVDVAGLVKGAHKGQGLGNQFLAQIRNCDAILEVVRCFEDLNIENVLGEINPEKEIEIVKIELLMKDLETLKNSISRLVKKRDKQTLKKIELLRKIEKAVSRGKLVSEADLTDKEKLEIKEYRFLTVKPIICILNTNRKPKDLERNPKHLIMNLKLEEEISELSESEIKELEVKSHLDGVITSCYNILDLITFFTITGGKETRAWTIAKGLNVPKAGGIVHSDYEKKFIKAELISWSDLVKVSSWNKAQELGKLKTAGKDYIVQDGDVIEFKI